jgi:hypothetical protein
MVMRVFLNNILSFIGSESLTDDEFSSVGVSVQEYSKEVYEALKTILQNREGVSGQLKKLQSYFVAKGVDLSSTPARAPASQILIGGPL